MTEEQHPRGAIVKMVPDSENHTCKFELLLDHFPTEGVYFDEDTYKQMRKGLVAARLNYVVNDNLVVEVLDENKHKGTITIKMSLG